MTDYIDSQGFRANVGIVLMRDGGELFLGGRRDGRGWQFPQGGVQRNERPEEALFRELHEEVGLERDDVELVASTGRWLRYRLPRQYVRRRGSPLCIGQKQRWFLLRMLGDEARLRFDATARARVRQLALGRLLVAGARSDLFQARRVRARAAGTRASRRSRDGPPPRPDWWTDELLRARSRRRAGGAGCRAGGAAMHVDADRREART